jgi:pyruvate formate lyase activating enzyme
LDFGLVKNNKSKMLTVFNIQRYSIHDGTGVRTNVFFKGCPLRCLWCNNPEGLESAPSLMFDERSCLQFGDCINAGSGQIFFENGKLVINRDLIPDINVYRNICPANALIVAGQEKSVSQILQEIEKDIPFYNTSDGGVTLTGGEPVSQGAELKELITELKMRGIHVSVETSLHLPWEVFENYIDLIDVFLADLKHVDAEKFTRFTGGDAYLVLNNFKKMDETGRKFIVRVPVIPGFNYSSVELFAIIDFAAGLNNAVEINFIPYHALAKEKYLMLGKDYVFGSQNNIEKSELQPFVEYAEQKGLVAKIMN